MTRSVYFGGARDIDAAVIANTRLSDDYNVLALDAPGDRRALARRAVRDGEAVARRPIRCCAGRSRSSKSCATRSGAPTGISILNKRIGVGTRAALRRRTGRAIACLGPLGRPFEPVDPPARGVDGRRRRRPGAVRDARRSAARAAARRRRSSTARGARAICTTSTRSSGSASRRARDRGRQPRRPAASSPARSNDALDRARPDGPVKLYVCGPTPMMRAVADSPSRHGRRCDVSLEQVMGCGLGGCYSCVVPVAQRSRGRRTSSARASTARSSTPTASSGRRWRIDPGPASVSIGSVRHRIALRRTRSSPPAAASATASSTATSSTSSTLGGVAVKGLFLAEREGHPPPRIVETPSGMLNAIGLQGIGVHRFVREKLPELRERRAIVFVNICGTTIDEYVELARILSDAEGVAALELNISCPNIKEGGITFGCSLTGTHDVVSAVRKVTPLPVIPKLTPNVTDVASFARGGGRGRRRCRLARQHVPGDGHRRRDPAAEAVEHRRRAERSGHPADRGAHGLRVPAGGEAADHRHGRHRHRRRRPRVHDRRRAAVQVGTANFVDPFIWRKLLDGLRRLHGAARHRAPRRSHGTLDTAQEGAAWISS